MIKVFLLVILFLISTSSAHANFRVDGETFTLSKVELPITKSVGGSDRGPAIAVMADGSVLLGGGERGGSIFHWHEGDQNPRKLGDLISQKERMRDSRFAITDIAILSETSKRANLLVSYPALQKGNCVSVAVHRVLLLKDRSKVLKKELWFKSSPCVPISAVQHAAGRMETINSKEAYLTIGDLGYEFIDDRNKRGDLGSVFKISKTKFELISTGHRNQQGIVLTDENELLTSEHGPRGGDEINVIEKGVDYGWPFVTYGAPYSSGDYVIPRATGTHKGYKDPIKVWTPSIAPTELIQLPNKGYGKFSSGLAMGTLREESIIFMEYRDGKILESLKVSIGSRIRDLELLPDQRIIASTDDGELLIMKSSAIT